ncbi:MAG: PEP/pyruvate-binding domain-containing protein [bacterium]|nr:PEP/pyruvate-binding domain-containing protein [bacterium]
MEFIKHFSHLTKENTDIAGGKGASLGEMTQAGIPVPPGFVVLASGFDKFLEECLLKADIDAILSKVDHKDVNSVDGASAKIRAMILNTEFPKDIQGEVEEAFKSLDAQYVAVRSSATAEDAADASWAGELESYLNTTKDDLLGKVKLCWSSLFTPRAIFYRFEKGLNTTAVSVAVVIQKMIQSEVSGICFTVHPVTEDKNQMVIEAGYGLGEAIVGGKITPDTYIIDKEKLDFIEKYVSSQEMMIVKVGKSGTKEVTVETEKQEKQKISDHHIIELAKIFKKIEEHYKFPQDIEWAFEKGKYYILQSRPITTLSS